MNCSDENKTIVMGGNLAKQISKSISVGSQSSKEIIHRISANDNSQEKKEEVVNTLKKSKHVRHIS